MRSRTPWMTLWLLGVAAAGSTLTVRAPVHAMASYGAVGRVVSITPDRTVVRIAHEAIPGLMGAMTMPFTARAPTQLAEVTPGDRVRFTFTVTDDGRRLLDAVGRAP